MVGPCQSISIYTGDVMTLKKSKKPLVTKKNTQKSSTLRYNEGDSTIWCTSCGTEDSMIIEGRCFTCIACGWSKCEI